MIFEDVLHGCFDWQIIKLKGLVVDLNQVLLQLLSEPVVVQHISLDRIGRVHQRAQRFEEFIIQLTCFRRKLVFRFNFFSNFHLKIIEFANQSLPVS